MKILNLKLFFPPLFLTGARFEMFDLFILSYIEEPS